MTLAQSGICILTRLRRSKKRLRLLLRDGDWLVFVLSATALGILSSLTRGPYGRLTLTTLPRGRRILKLEKRTMKALPSLASSALGTCSSKGWSPLLGCTLLSCLARLEVS